MYHKYFGILIQSCFNKFFPIDKLYLFGVEQNLGYSVELLNMFFLYKLDIYSIKNEEKHP